MVRCSRVAPCVTCGLCGGILRDATTISECLHSFFRKCIFKKFEDEDINRCPKCGIHLGCDPVEKLRADHSLIRIRLMVFPAKRRKVEEIPLLHPALVSLPSPSPRVNGVGHSVKKNDAYLMGEHMSGETETEAGERLGMEPSASPTKPDASNPHTAVASGAGPASLASSVDSGDGQGDARRVQLAERGLSIGELQRAMQGLRTEHLTPISELAIQFDELKCEDDDPVATQAMPPERITPAEEVGLLIVAAEKQRRGRAATESTLSSAVKIVVEGTAALSSVASQSETYENTARTLESIEVYICRSQALEAENARLIEELKNERAEKADAVERTRILEEMRLQGEPDITLSTAKMLEMLQAYTDRSQSLGAANIRLTEELVNERVEKAAAFERARILEEERLQRESEVAQSAARMLKMLQAYTGQNQTLGAVNARLREELKNERAEKAADFERTRILDMKLQTEPGKLQIESGIQKTEAAQIQLVEDYQALESDIAARRLLFQDYHALQSEISEKDAEHTALQYNIKMLEKEKTCLEHQVDYLTKSLAQRSARIFERLDAYIGRSQGSEAENARLREELDIERAKRAAAFEMTRILEERLQGQSEVAQRTEAALKQLLSDYHALESEISEGSE